MSNTQVTFDVNPANARSESSIAINPSNPSEMIGGSKKFFNPMTYSFTLATSWSNNGGKTWQASADIPLLAGWAGISDPAVCWDDSDNVYLLALPFKDPNLTTVGIAAYKSTDKGKTWSKPKLIHSSAGDDKQWMAGDKNNGHLYAAWDDGSNMRFARSLDQGSSWKGKGNEPVGSILTNDSFSPEINVADNGNIYIAYISGSNIKFIRSTDGGDSFSAPTVIASGITTLSAALPITDGWPHFPGATFRVLTLPTACAGQNQVVVAAWADMREGSSRIYYRRSTDEGASWLGNASGEKLQTQAIAANLHHFHPQIVSQPNGDIGCSFYEIGPKGNYGKMLIDTCLCTSIDNGQSFYDYVVVTDKPWDPAIDAPLSHGDPNVTFIGDYFGLDASVLGFYPLWTDTRTNIQELFTNVPLSVSLPPWKYYAIVVRILFGIVGDGGGAYIDANGHIHIVPPRGPGDPGPYYTDTLLTLSSLKAAEKIKGNEGKQMQKQALRSIIGLAQKHLKKLDVGKGAGKKT
jgi:hypothetical protein